MQTAASRRNMHADSGKCHVFCQETGQVKVSPTCLGAHVHSPWGGQVSNWAEGLQAQFVHNIVMHASWAQRPCWVHIVTRLVRLNSKLHVC